jgi:3-deoxy-D-manno-octulosonic-acid transferase
MHVSEQPGNDAPARQDPGRGAVRTCSAALYGLAWTGALAAASPYLLYRAWRHPGEMRERFGRGEPPAELRGALWMHAASLGEMRGALPLLSAVVARGVPTTLHVVTPSAYALRAEASAAGAGQVRFAPFDFRPLISRCIGRTAPRALLVCETEIWPGMLDVAAGRQIPVAFVSARLTRRGWRRLRLLRPYLRRLLAGVHVGAQSDRDAGRWIDLGAQAARVAVTGNTKYERPRGPLAAAKRLQGRAGWRHVLVLGSVRRGEVLELREALEAMGGLPGPALVVIAPRHTEHADQIARVLAPSARVCVDRHRKASAILPAPAEVMGTASSASGAAASRPAMLMVRTTGELRHFYALADLGFVGGTLCPIGGHSLFEVAELGVPVFYGPHTANVADVASALEEAGGGVRVASGAALGAALRAMLAAPRVREAAAAGAFRAAASLGGAVARTLAALDAWGFPLR